MVDISTTAAPEGGGQTLASFGSGKSPGSGGRLAHSARGRGGRMNASSAQVRAQRSRINRSNLSTRAKNRMLNEIKLNTNKRGNVRRGVLASITDGLNNL